MNAFLEFKNKKLEDRFYDKLDSYTSHMIVTHTLLAITALPTGLVNQALKAGSFLDHISCGMQWTGFFIVLLLMGLLARSFRTKLAKYKRISRWALDLFYTCLSAFLLFIGWNAMTQNAPPPVLYLVGWWHCLVCTATLCIISRWYLKAMAFCAVVIRMGLGAYFEYDRPIFLNLMIGITLFMCLNSYFQERSEKKRFIEKYKFEVETAIFKEILHQTTEGIIISDLEGKIQFKNLSEGKFGWWDENHSFSENLEQIEVEQQINLLEQTMDTVFKILEI